MVLLPCDWLKKAFPDRRAEILAEALARVAAHSPTLRESRVLMVGEEIQINSEETKRQQQQQPHPPLSLQISQARSPGNVSRALPVLVPHPFIRYIFTHPTFN